MDDQNFADATQDELVNLDCALDYADDIGELETCTSATYDWYHEAERDMQEYLARMRQEVDAEPTATTTTPPAATGATDPAPVEATPEEEEDFFPTDRSASYGEAWEDEPLCEWQPEKLLKRSRRKGVTYYLVQWCSKRADTWEMEEDLEEEGHAPLIRAFAAERAAQQAEKAEQQALMHKQQKEQKERKEGEVSTPIAKPVKPETPFLPKNMQFDPTVYWRGFQAMIHEKFHADNMHPLEIFNVCNSVSARAFMQNWERKVEGVPAMLFHGTRREAVEGITRTGLRVPRSGENPIQVANGSALGVGIYTGVRPSISHGYTRGLGAMFVCAGLIQTEFETPSLHNGNVCVFFEDAQVLPCFLVTYRCAHEVGGDGTDVPEYHHVLSEAKLQEVLNTTPTYINTPAVTFNHVQRKIAQLRLKYKNGLIASAMAPPAVPPTIRQGGTGPGLAYDKQNKTLTKKQLRAAPRAAKEAYKKGFLQQKQN